MLWSDIFAIAKWSIWQYRLSKFQAGNTKLERFLPKNQHTRQKFLNFENWVNGEVSNLGIILESNDFESQNLALLTPPH